VSLLNGGRNLVRNALLSPAAGASVFVLVLFECSRWGVAVQTCGPIITVLCIALTMAALWRGRYRVPWRQLMPFLAILGAGILLVGYPLLIHGFNWFSYGNDDMANYVLGAEGFLKRGYLQSFDPALLIEWRDMALSRWLRVILDGERHGCELTLAWVMSLTRLSGHQVFMPVIVALDMVLISAAGALIVQGRKQRLAGLVTCAWMAVSSLVALGTVYQLIAQVFGLGLLSGTSALLLEPSRWAPPRAGLKRALLAGVFCGALGITYPEVIPFLVLAFVLTHILRLWRRQETIRALTLSTGIALVSALVLWNNFADCIPRFLLHQATAGLKEMSLADPLFPYYLLPSGLATFWGFLPIAQTMSEPKLDIAIAGGALLLALATAAALWQAWRGRPVAAIAVVMLGLTIRLASMNSDFGLYKLAMYIQPFLLGSIVLTCLEWKSKRIGMAVRILPLTIVAALGVSAQLHYVRLSAAIRGESGGGFVEVPEASSRHLLSLLKRLGSTPHRPLIVSDASNVVLAKVESIYLAPVKQEYTSGEFFVAAPDAGSLQRWYPDLVRPGFVSGSLKVIDNWEALHRRANFDMQGGPANSFYVSRGRANAETGYSVLTSGASLSALNRRLTRSLAEPMVSWMDSQQTRNYLVEVDSDLGQNYYRFGGAGGRERVAMFQLEPDYFYPGRTITGAGRYILFEVLNPSPHMRVELDYTASLKTDGRNIIPPAQIIGESRRSFGTLGRGSARVFSPPLEPQNIDGRHYVVLDMGAPAQIFPQRRTGLMRLFGTSVALDSRRLTGFIRDISALGQNDYEQLDPPAGISHFPGDLSSKDLEYSGIYEDGWVAEESFLALRQPAQQAQLTVRAMVPELGQKATRLRITVDGSQVAEAGLKPGSNEVRAIVQSPAGRRRVDLRFDGGAALPVPDGRIVSAKLEYVGFIGGIGEPGEIAKPPVTISDHWYPFEKFGGETFRWVENDARFTVMGSARQAGELAIDMEPGPGMGGKPLALSLILPDGSKRVLPSATGRRTIRIPLTLGSRSNELALRCDGGGTPTPGDPRKLNFRIFGITWNPRSTI
jgi:hypothetical protein